MEYTNETNEKVVCYCDECLIKKILDASLCSAWASDSDNKLNDEFISNLQKIKDDLNKLSVDFKNATEELNKKLNN